MQRIRSAATFMTTLAKFVWLLRRREALRTTGSLPFIA